jgi:hypothetical protein
LWRDSMQECGVLMVAGFCYEADMDIQSDSPWEIVP